MASGSNSRIPPLVTPNTGVKMIRDLLDMKEKLRAQEKLVNRVIFGQDETMMVAEDSSGEDCPELTPSSSAHNQGFVQTPAPSSKTNAGGKAKGLKPILKKSGGKKVVLSVTEEEEPSMEVVTVQLDESWDGEKKDEADAANLSVVSRQEDKFRRILLEGHYGYRTCFEVLEQAEGYIRECFGRRVLKHGVFSKVYKCPRYGCEKEFSGWYKLFLHYEPHHLNVFKKKLVHPLRCRADRCDEGFRDAVELLKHAQEKHAKGVWVSDFYDMLEHAGLV